ncbi:class I SAM-dependent methyltransferase [Massilia yuzhufengensis]|uniref:Methyltransferase domain-containing protein n=1 Tax=Massilia yuzhufengensis TaxID=1164594 RepID=A0A1I1VX63_9BURK|nr:class I SAM-dependent methyltransferase [Massilia yuzhufengensis]SFD85170.1 Methyltransferase domain-containing protein [Massilia yuzhufengensis]
MSDWTGGYVADIVYTHGYYAELNPQRLKLAFLMAGHVFPEVGTACELGFGQGVSTNVHAAASVTQWYGTDFNPAQAGYAQELAAASGAHARLYDEAFEDFANRSDLPEFDFICLHGIWSWINDANRQVIIDFIRRKLKVGGVVYISYNTQPGWAAMAPLRDLLAEHAQVMGAQGSGIVPRIDAALDFASRLLAGGAAYGRANPGVAKRLEAIGKQDRQYVAHEYFNRHWVPMSFAKMAEWLDAAKLTYATSASYLDHVDSINFNADQQQMLKELQDRMFRETVRDFMVNQQFRKDYWVRGARQLAPLEQQEQLRRQRFVLVRAPDRITLAVSGALGEANMQENVYRPILARLAGFQPFSLGELQEEMKSEGIAAGAVLQAIVILIGKGVLEPVQDAALIDAAHPTTRRLNRKLCEQARHTDTVSVLASPVTGGGLSLGRVDRLYLLARANGAANTEDAARFIVDALTAAGQNLVKDGKALDLREAALAEGIRIVKSMDEQLLPLLTALRIDC